MDVVYGPAGSCFLAWGLLHSPHVPRFPGRKSGTSIRDISQLQKKSRYQQSSPIFLPLPASQKQRSLLSAKRPKAPALWACRVEKADLVAKWKTECCFQKPHSHSQIVDYLKGKFNSTKKFVQLHEAADVINWLFPKEHQTLNFPCSRGADIHS